MIELIRWSHIIYVEYTFSHIEFLFFLLENYKEHDKHNTLAPKVLNSGSIT